MSRDPASGVDAGALRLLGPGAAPLLRAVGRLAAQAGSRAYLVGGPVRDLLLWRESRDLDVVVVGDAIEIAGRLRRETGGRVIEHRAFGTATLELPDGRHLDFAAARRERYAQPAALPRVEPSDIEEDLWRRDFTINSLAVELSRGRFGRLLDPTGGVADLQARRIRALHERSFIDDPTRSFRAVEFASRLAFRIERRTVSWIDASNRGGMVRRLSSARLRRQLASVLDAADLPRTVSLLQRYALLEAIDPSLRYEPEQRAAIRRLHAGLSPGRFLPALDLPPRWIAVVSLLSLGARRGQRDRILERLRPPRHWARVMPVTRRDVALLRRRLAGDRRRRPSEVVAACEGRSDLAVLLAATTATRPVTRRVLARYLNEWAGVTTDLSGNDLIAAGVPEGPPIARGLQAARAVKLDGPNRSRETQLAAATRSAGVRRLTGSAGID